MNSRYQPLIQQLEQRAAELDGYAPAGSRAFREAAQTAAAFLADFEAEELSLEEAARESGYTRGHLRRLISEGQIPATEAGRIERRHLPRKPRACGPRSKSAIPSASEIARQIVEGG